LGDKTLWDIERVFRDLKHVVDIRPVYHRKDERIRAHVLLCWLSLLLIRVAGNATEATWHQMKKAFDTMQVGIHSTDCGEV
jgi:transposase